MAFSTSSGRMPLDRQLGPQRADRFDRRVGQVAGGVVLEQGVLDQEAVALVLEPLPVDFFAARGRRVGVALPAVDRLGVRGEAPHREPRREQAPLGGVACVERLGHRAEVRLETARLGSGEAEGVGELLVARAQQVAGGGGSAVDPDRRGRVPALDVGRRPDQCADPRLHLDADDEGDEQPLTGGPHLLRLRQGRREHRHGGMAAHHAVGVVEVERMAGRAVEQRGDSRRAVEVGAHDRARAGLGAQFRAQDVGQRFAAADQRAAEPVEHALAGHGAGGPRNVVEAQGAEAVPEVVGESHGVSSSTAGAGCGRDARGPRGGTRVTNSSSTASRAARRTRSSA